MGAVFDRRAFLLTLGSLVFLPAGAARAAGLDAAAAATRLAAIETSLDGRLGLFALNTADGRTLAHRSDERFAMCSTFKLVLAGAILAQSAQTPGLLERRVAYGPEALVSYSPITQKHAAGGMTVAALCAAAVRHSDNTAANLLLDQLDGPAALTTFARTIGDNHFRLDRREPELNTAIPGDPRDTTTPAAMGRSLQRLALGRALPAEGRALLCAWLRGCVTGAARIRAGVPAGWVVGDKTGTGAYGVANDVAVLWPAAGAPPVLLAIYTARRQKDAAPRNDVIVAAAKVVAEWLGAAA
ncbi:Beta-lactamase [Desulfarculus baarsii DSM 2075]|uniref:Beta-lactamase n=1 Tax=Desulfarculus baarsii (strain ATCC 33931 / DSM 2075 / LMG 7858 / VKM B-1802 / 2st14) TaxID=644282 RepID=E1QJV5_DESB2|nr:class A beta-lactamase [Desulfarculus baarsii]ADK85848.1 Beta-lactamase [Desulfarculus baarsii DSM 2075]6WJM_A Chain A, Beta-lactamase [Desulfarculus baarsii DSM 2075]